MDKAMSVGTAYFKSCFEDIRGQRFVRIINEPLNLVILGEDYAFGDKNDIYVWWITWPLTYSYEVIYKNNKTGVELLIPRKRLLPANLQCEMITQ